ncbi:MAG: PAS domain S-box protein [Betaproteobacteria bacterium]
MPAHDSNDLYRQLLDSSSDPVFCFDSDCRYLYANHAFADGIGKSLDEIIGRTVWDVFPKDQADKRAALIKLAFDHAQVRSHEILVHGKDGDRYYLTTLTPIFGDQGQMISVLANSKDITKRKKLEDELRNNQTLLARTEKFTHIGSWAWDVTTDTVTWSDELFRIFQRNPADGAPSFAEHAKLYFPEDMQRLKDAVTAAVSNGTPYEMELRAIRGDGEPRVCLARGHPEISPDQKISLLFGSLHDITERKRAEVALSESEAFLRVIIDSVPDQIAVIDQNGVIVRVNEPWRRFSLENSTQPGQPVPHTDVGTNYIDVCRVSSGSDAENSDAAREGILAVLDGRLPGFSMEYPCHSPDQRRWFAMRVSPLEGNRHGAVIAHTNITGLKQAEAELIEHRDHLEELVAARTSELAQSRDAAEAGSRAKTIFLANMSHELRTPMNGVIGMIDLVLRRATDPQQIYMLNKSKDAAQHMVNVVNDIIDFSKAEADGLTLEEKSFSLSQVIEDAIAIHGIAAEMKGLNLTYEVSADFPEQLSGDAFRVRQILLNFLGNACKFSERGTITVRVSAVEQVGESVLARLEVEDQGIGIGPEKQARLFQAFTQADGSLTRKHGGSGLGLVISKRLAELMGGEVGMESQEGRGSTFWATVRLKLAHASGASV